MQILQHSKSWICTYPLAKTIYGDKAYTDYALEDYLEETENIRLIPDRKANLKRQHTGCIRYLQSILRKRIETTFSQLVSLFPRKIHAAYEEWISFKASCIRRFFFGKTAFITALAAALRNNQSGKFSD